MVTMGQTGEGRESGSWYTTPSPRAAQGNFITGERLASGEDAALEQGQGLQARPLSVV